MSLRPLVSRRLLATASKAGSEAAELTPIATQYARLAKQWPSDPLRPDAQFASLISQRQAMFETLEKLTPEQEALERTRLNALVSLLEDRAAIRNPVPEALLRPESNPDHYSALISDIEQAPSRTASESWWLWLSGKVRLR